MPRLSLLLLLAFLLVSAFFALNSMGDLPEKVATHFLTNGWLMLRLTETTIVFSYSGIQLAGGVSVAVLIYSATMAWRIRNLLG